MLGRPCPQNDRPRGTPARAWAPLALGLLLACPGLAGVRPGEPLGGLAPAPDRAGRSGPPNILILLADDLGVDKIGAYGEHPNPPATPVIDELARRGVLFRSAWSSPNCSPTRAGLLTGRLGFRTGVTTAFSYGASPYELPLEETTLPEVLAPLYSSAAVGKWHLAGATLSGPMHPLLSGFDHHRGTIDSFGKNDPPSIYYDFVKHVDGQPVPTTGYITSDTVDDALELARRLPEPWLLYVAFNAPHIPFHKPPPELTATRLPPGDPTDTPALHYRAAVEALDSEIGRLLAALPPPLLARTTVIFAGDNGTPAPATTAPFDSAHSKNTVYEGGVRVPLIVAGRGVPAVGEECPALVMLTDLFATVAELAGRPQDTGLDAISLVPWLSAPRRPGPRPWIYAEQRKPVGPGPWTVSTRAVRSIRFKLIHDTLPSLSGPWSFFDLAADPFEQVDLLQLGPLSPDQQAVHDALRQVLDEQYPP